VFDIGGVLGDAASAASHSPVTDAGTFGGSGPEPRCEPLLGWNHEGVMPWSVQSVSFALRELLTEVLEASGRVLDESRP
jgi:hypothetical protein